MRAWPLVALGLSSLCGVALAEPSPGPERTEGNIVPIIGGSSDIGLGIGEVSGLARVGGGYDPYKWRIETSLFVTAKLNEGFVLPYQDAYVLLTVPDLIPHRMRLDARIAFTNETTLAYDGLGNASTKVFPPGITDDEYKRVHPELEVHTRWSMVPHVFFVGGFSYTQNWVTSSDNTRLAYDRDRKSVV